MKDMITVEGIRKSFQQQIVLDQMNFAVKQGDIVGLLGPNGSGKTTMIRLLNGVIFPDSGRMSVGGYDPVHEGNPIRQMSGIVTEGAGFYHEMSGLQNLKFFAEIYSVPLPEARIKDLLERFGLAEHQDKAVGQYSTGMKKRLGLAKALLHQPSILFLDEPTNGLDPEGIQSVLEFLKELNQEQGTTILLCSHVLHQMERVCDQYVFMSKGQVIAQGTQRELEQRYLGTIKLKVETNLHIVGQKYQGYSVERLNDHELLFTLGSREEIPTLLQKILSEASVFETKITNRDLESLYFQVRGKTNE